MNMINKETAMLDALVEMCVSAHILNLKDESIETIKTNKFIDVLSNEKDSLQDKLTHIMGNISAPECTEGKKAFVNLSSLPLRLMSAKTVSYVFKGKVNGWCKASFLRLDDTPTCDQLLYVVESIDEFIGKQIDEKSKMKQESEKLLFMLEALAHDYDSIWFVDTTDLSLHLVKAAFSTDDKLNLNNIVDSNYNSFMSQYIDTFIVEEDRDKVSALASIEGLMKATSEVSHDTIDYVLRFDGGDARKYSANYSRVYDDDNHLYFVCGVRKIK